MSLFKTQVPVDLEAVKKLLPKDAFIENVVFDAREKRLDVFWHTSALATPYTVAVDFPVQLLEARKLPDKVTEAAPRPTPHVPHPAPPGAVIPPKPVKPSKPRKGAVSVDV